jgi:hypothetical protein
VKVPVADHGDPVAAPELDRVRRVVHVDVGEDPEELPHRRGVRGSGVMVSSTGTSGRRRRKTSRAAGNRGRVWPGLGLAVGVEAQVGPVSGSADGDREGNPGEDPADTENGKEMHD